MNQTQSQIVSNPYAVHPSLPRTYLYVGDHIPLEATVLALTATNRSIFRFAGGMNLDPNVLFPFFLEAFRKAGGSVFMSGGTRAFQKDLETAKYSVCEVVPLLVEAYGGVGMGSFPRTGTFGFWGPGRFLASDYKDTAVNPGTQMVIAVQKAMGDDGKVGWNGDLIAYIEFLCALRDEHGFKPMVTVYEGGDVTVEEAVLSHENKLPVVVVTGTGRAADDRLSPNKFKGEGIYHVDVKQPLALNALLKEQGYI